MQHEYGRFSVVCPQEKDRLPVNLKGAAPFTDRENLFFLDMEEFEEFLKFDRRRLLELGMPAVHVIAAETGLAHDLHPLLFRYHVFPFRSRRSFKKTADGPLMAAETFNFRAQFGESALQQSMSS